MSTNLPLIVPDALTASRMTAGYLSPLGEAMGDPVVPTTFYYQFWPGTHDVSGTPVPNSIITYRYTKYFKWVYYLDGGDNETETWTDDASNVITLAQTSNYIRGYLGVCPDSQNDTSRTSGGPPHTWTFNGTTINPQVDVTWTPWLLRKGSWKVNMSFSFAADTTIFVTGNPWIIPAKGITYYFDFPIYSATIPGGTPTNVTKDIYLRRDGLWQLNLNYPAYNQVEPQFLDSITFEGWWNG